MADEKRSDGQSIAPEHWLYEKLCEAMESGFYGKLTLQFEKGVVKYLRVEETIKPPT